MNLRYVQFLAVLFWGFQTDLLWFAIPMGLVWEGQFILNRRWQLTKQDFYRVADVTSFAFVFIVVFLVANRADYHFVTTLVGWLPILFFPLIVFINYSTTTNMSLDILFYSLRRQKQPVTQSWDMNYLLFGMCIIGAGANTDIGVFYFPIVSLLVCLALFPIRPKRHPIGAWIVAICVVFVAAYATQQSIRGTHLELKRRTAAWIAAWVQQRTNPLKTHTAIGSIGKLKLSNEILFRLQVPKGASAPQLLQEASYNLPTGNGSWTVMKPSFSIVEHTDDFRWQVNMTHESDIPATIYLEFAREQALIPLPIGATEIYDLPALDIKQTYYGAVQGIGLVPAPKYHVNFHPGKNLNGAPDATDTYIPAQYEPLLQQAIVTTPLNAAHPVDSLNNFFKEFRYSLYQDVEGADQAFANFLLEHKAGHCEYFATASVLLLRQMGIPARYVVGYSVQEYSDLLDMYLVRRRHGHAWAIAFIEGRWQVVDTTPDIWLDKESEQASLMQPLFDLATNSNFLFQVWWHKQRLEDYKLYFYIVGSILSLILLWRMMTSKQVILPKQEADPANPASPGPGSDSPFFRLEVRLQAQGFIRGPGELLVPWLNRINQEQLIDLLPLHNQWRFDPHGISKQQKLALAQQVERALMQIEKELDSSVH